MAGICEQCMTNEARSPHDLFCDECEAAQRRPKYEHRVDTLVFRRDGTRSAVQLIDAHMEEFDRQGARHDWSRTRLLGDGVIELKVAAYWPVQITQQPGQASSPGSGAAGQPITNVE